MNTKILQLTQSPIILSDTDMQNFIKLMEFPDKYIEILKDAKKVIKNYYINNIVNIEDEKLIDNALLLVQGKKIEEIKVLLHNDNQILLTEEMMSILLFIYSPPYDLLIYYNDYLHLLENTDDVERIREGLYKISDKHVLEEMIIQGEKKFIENFEDYISNTRTEIEQLLNTDIGNIFLLNEQIITSIKNEMTKYRNILSPKIQEVSVLSQQLKNYWIQTEETTGDIAQSMFQGAGMGMLGATLLGPVGIAIAVGANVLMNSDKVDKQSAIEDDLIENWGKTADNLYLTQLKEYHTAYQTLRKNLTYQIFQNYKEAEQLAIQLDKHKEYLEYVNTDFYQITKEQEDKEYFENIKSFENYFN